MRTTVIPAQVTTVEDTIAGTLTLSQIVLFVASIFLATAIYALVPTPFAFSLEKILLITLLGLTCLTLAIRFKGKLILHWLLLMTSYGIRPHRYTYNKNSLVSRTIVPKKENVVHMVHEKSKSQAKTHHQGFTFDYHQLMKSTTVQLSFKQGKIIVAKSI